MREDIKVWLTFLSKYNGVTVITDNAWASNEILELRCLTRDITLTDFEDFLLIM
jgi:hypothetical protein